jgi:hypothetical protein
MSAKGNRRAKILQGRVDPERAAGNAYVVFASADTMDGALSANMHEVGRGSGFTPAWALTEACILIIGKASQAMLSETLR